MIAAVAVPTLRARLTYHLPDYGVALAHLPWRAQDSGDPTYVHFARPTVYLDDAALRRGGALLPAGAEYAVLAHADANTRADVEAGARLFFAPALQVRAPRRARWILTYRTGLPRAAVAGPRYALGGGFALTRVRGWRASS